MHLPVTALRAALCVTLTLLFSLLPIPFANAALPAAASATPAVLEGEVEVLVEDYAGGRSHTRHFLVTGQRRVELVFARRPAPLLSGSRVRVRGRLAGDTLALDSTADGVEVVQAALPYTLGEQRTAVILVNFHDNPVQPISASAAHSLVFGTVDGFYREASFEQTWLAGDTFGWYTVPVSGGVCDSGAIQAEADKAVAAQGVDLSAYRRKLYLFPKNACGWAGLANVGGGDTRAWINGSFNLHTIGHELGHNQGVSHSHSRDCGGVALGGECTVADYGDVADIMGAVRAAHFSPFQKELMGWLNDGVSPPIHTAVASGRYSIEPYSSASPGPKAIRIPRGRDASGRRLWYYLEYRQPIGADAALGSVGTLTQGVLVRLATEGDRYSSDLLDMTPGSYAYGTGDFQDGALAVGRTHAEAAADVSFTLVSADANGATVDVAIGGATAPACTRAPPELGIDGPTATVAAGTTVAYTVTLTNRDSGGCDATGFDLAYGVPSGWTGALAAGSVSLSPGASATTTLSVTSPATAAAGSYGIGVGTGSGAGDVHAASASIAYSVAAPSGGTLTSAVGTDKASYKRGETVRMSALVKRGGVAVAGAGVRFTVTLPSGATRTLTATTGSDGYARAAYRTDKGKRAVGRYGLRADASLDGGAASATDGFEVF